MHLTSELCFEKQSKKEIDHWPNFRVGLEAL